MNQQFIQAIQQIKSAGNPKQMAMNCLQRASQHGNPMAKNLLEQISTGNRQGAEQILNNFMNEQGVNLEEIKKFMNQCILGCALKTGYPIANIINGGKQNV